jgi:hypothetical protein
MELARPNAAETPGAAEASGGGSAAGSDSLLIHPYLWPAIPLKAPVLGKLKKLSQLLNKGDREGAAYLQALESARSQLGAALESAAVGDQAVTDAAARYLALLLGVTSSFSDGKAAGGGSAATADVGSPDEALAAAEAGAGTAGGKGFPLAGAPSKLRQAGAWEWGDGALVAPAPGAPPRKAASSDAIFELAQVLVAMAVRLMHAASVAAGDSASGVPTASSTRAYNLLRQAAGMLDFAVREVVPSLPAGAAADLDPQLLRGLASTALADAQQLTLLRAVVKGNQPSLIAAIAADTAELYALAGSQVGSSTVAGAAASKLAQYAKYKQVGRLRSLCNVAFNNQTCRRCESRQSLGYTFSQVHSIKCLILPAFAAAGLRPRLRPHLQRHHSVEVGQVWGGAEEPGCGGRGAQGSKGGRRRLRRSAAGHAQPAPQAGGRRAGACAE